MAISDGGTETTVRLAVSKRCRKPCGSLAAARSLPTTHFVSGMGAKSSTLVAPQMKLTLLTGEQSTFCAARAGWTSQAPRATATTTLVRARDANRVIHVLMRVAFCIAFSPPPRLQAVSAVGQ